MLDEPIPIEGATSLVLYDHTQFARLIEQFYDYSEVSETLKLCDASYKPLKETDIMLITDILGLDVNSASVLKQVYADLEMQISLRPEVKTEIELKLQDVTNLINKEILDFELDLESKDTTLQDKFKAMGIRVEICSETIFDRVFEIIKVFKYLTKKKLMVLINLATYLTSEEMKSICEYATLQRIDFLMLDTKEFQGVKNQYILDEDYVLLQRNMI
jgi:CRISPR-associated protein Csn2